MVFRDSFDRCPRCGVTLEDARSARGCRSCGGAFVEEPILAEMLLQMLPPPPRAYGRIALSEVQRSGQPLACPTCGDAMTPTTLHDVELDHCKKHGVWFDPDELRITLYRVADPANPPPFNEWTPIDPLLEWTAPPPPRPPRPRPAPTPPVGARAWVMLRVTQPDGSTHDVTLDNTVIKIGRIRSMHVIIERDPDVSRMHAVLEHADDGLVLIDLGSAAGTYVNDARATKCTVNVGDTIRVGSTRIEVVSRGP